MANKRNKLKERQIGKNKQEKKPLIDPRYKNFFWTTVVVIILLIFFIVNNTRDVPAHGPYPPNYDPAKHHSDTHLNKDLYGLSATDTNNNKQ